MIPPTGYLPRLEGALRTLVAADAPAVERRAAALAERAAKGLTGLDRSYDDSVMSAATPTPDVVAARAELGGIADAFRGEVETRRGALDRGTLGTLNRASNGLDMLALGESTDSTRLVQHIADAWEGAVLLDADALAAGAGGRVTVDSAKVARLLPDAHGPLDTVTAQRVAGTSAALRGVVPYGTGPDRVLSMAISTRWSELVPRMGDADHALAPLRSLTPADLVAIDQGPSARDAARTEVRNLHAGLPVTEYDDAPTAIDAAELAAPTGSLQRVRALTRLLDRDYAAVLAVRSRVADGALASNDPLVVPLLETGREHLAELAASSDAIAQATGVLKWNVDVEGAAAKVDRLLEKARSGAPLDWEGADGSDAIGLSSPAASVRHGIDEILAGGLDVHDALLGELGRVNALPTRDLAQLGSIAAAALERAVADTAAGSTPTRERALTKSLTAILDRMSDAAERGQELPATVRDRIDAAITTLDGRRSDGAWSSGSLRASLHGRTSELLAPDFADVAARIRAIDALAVEPDVAAVRAAITERAVVPLPEGQRSDTRTSMVTNAWQRVASSLRARGIADHVERAPDERLWARAMANAPSVVRERGGDHADPLRQVLAGRGREGDAEAALRLLLSDAPSTLDRSHIDQLTHGRAAAADPALEAAPLAVRLRGRAAAIESALGAMDGMRHDAASMPQLLGSLAGLVDDIDAVPLELRGAIAPHATDDVLSEVARAGHAAILTSRDGGRLGLWQEWLWPDRGVIGKSLVDARMLADMHELAAPGTM